MYHRAMSSRARWAALLVVALLLVGAWVVLRKPQRERDTDEARGHWSTGGQPELLTRDVPPAPRTPDAPSPPAETEVIPVALDGVVENDDGEPVAHATVVAINTDDEPSAQAVSGVDGSFRIAGVARGAYELMVVAVGYASRSLRDVIAPGTIQIVLVRLGTAQFALRLPENVVPDHASVHVRSLDLGTGRRAVVAREGHVFRMSGIPSGNIEITISALGLVPTRVVRRDVAPGADVDLGLIDLVEGVDISGRVFDPIGKPVADIGVRLDGRKQTSFTTKEGTFSVGPVAPGSAVTLRVVGGMRYLDITQVVDPREGAAPLVLRVKHGALLEGRVRRADGTVEAGASLRLIDKGDPPQSDEALGLDENGVFIVRLAPGPYRLELFRPASNVAVETRALNLVEGEKKQLQFTLPTR